MRKTHVTHFTWVGDEMITVPDFPAWVCDICGKREYDLQALNRLSAALLPSSEEDVFQRVPKSRRPKPGAHPRAAK